MNKQLHIVSFDAPSPPDYGGAIDVYHKIIALAEAGIDITLHYFQYKAQRHSRDLEQYCKAIYAYDRKPLWKCMASPLPFIVASRINQELIARLNKDQHPILLEGVHCTGILPRLQQNRKVLLRLHNNEAAYYQRLSSLEKQPLRNLYYLIEANRLERYQRKLPKDIPAAAIARNDAAFFSNDLAWASTTFVPAFIPWVHTELPSLSDNFFLYHGNLAVAENESTVVWLLKHVAAKTTYPFVVAGSGASEGLQKILSNHNNVRFVQNPTDTALQGIIESAQVHLLPSLNQTGVKLKLLHALFSGRHCITNTAGVWGSGLEEAVTVADDADAMVQSVERLMKTPFAEAQKKQRQALLHLYDNGLNAKAIIQLIY